MQLLATKVAVGMTSSSYVTVDRNKVRPNIDHVGIIKPHYGCEQDHTPEQKGDAALRIQPLEPEEEVEIYDVLDGSDFGSSWTTDNEHVKAGTDDDSEDETAPEVVASASEPKFSSRGRRLSSPIDSSVSAKGRKVEASLIVRKVSLNRDFD